MANFKFKIISKTLAERLAQLMPSLISAESNGLIQGRNIKDYVCLAFQRDNIMHNKIYGGNIALKCH